MNPFEKPYLLFVFLAKKAARYVENSAVSRQEFEGSRNYLLLKKHVGLYPFFGKLQFYVRVSPKRPCSRARGIDNDPIHLMNPYFHKTLFVVVELDIRYACSRESLFGLGEGNFARLVNKYLPLALEEMGDGQ